MAHTREGAPRIQMPPLRLHLLATAQLPRAQPRAAQRSWQTPTASSAGLGSERLATAVRPGGAGGSYTQSYASWYSHRARATVSFHSNAARDALDAAEAAAEAVARRVAQACADELELRRAAADAERDDLDSARASEDSARSLTGSGRGARVRRPSSAYELPAAFGGAEVGQLAHGRSSASVARCARGAAAETQAELRTFARPRVARPGSPQRGAAHTAMARGGADADVGDPPTHAPGRRAYVPQPVALPPGFA
jgi:hypothetical protein